MLESAEVGHAISKAVYAREERTLREALLNAQWDLSQAKRGPVLMIIAGVEAGGRGETANKLTEWMDPRHIRVVAFPPRTGAELARPAAWRYWHAMPPSGRLGIFMNAWYTDVLTARQLGQVDDDVLQIRMQTIRHQERMLTEEGVVLLKFWVHLSKADQKARLEKLEKDPRTSWRVTRADWEAWRLYSKSHALWELVLRETSSGEAPWYVVEGTDDRYRNMTVGKILLDSIQHLLAAAKPVAVRHALTPPSPSVLDNVKLMRDLDLSQKLPKRKYEIELDRLQGRLAKLTRHRRFARHSLILAFEGVDAAGKGGAIRRVTAALDARQYVVVPVAAPSDEERAHPYLWRFWRQVPPLGGITIFDRSWYGRVLVERVEGYCQPEDWMRAYDEINQFEEQLVEAGAVLLKFWLQISKAEQLKRFGEREKVSFKRFKITPEDWRNRKKWNQYELAVSDMVYRTGTELAPWTLVEAEDKNYARVKVLTTIVKRLEAALD